MLKARNQVIILTAPENSSLTVGQTVRLRFDQMSEAFVIVFEKGKPAGTKLLTGTFDLV
jgi:hypothetical protein